MTDSLDKVRKQLAGRIADLHGRAARLSPLEIHAQMDAIRQAASVNGLAALASLAHCSAQLALLPGHRVTTERCFDHMADALDSRSGGDCATILAALALRLN